MNTKVRRKNIANVALEFFLVFPNSFFFFFFEHSGCHEYNDSVK